MINIFAKRLKNLALLMEKNELDSLLVTKAENIRYLSGFTGGSDARLLVSPTQNYILTDSRYTEQVKIECPEWQLLQENPPGLKQLAETSQQFKNIGIEAHVLTVKDYQEMQTSLECELKLVTNVVEELRQVKDVWELELMRESCRITDNVFSEICHFMRTGLDEIHIASEIVYLLRQKGCDKEAFDVIVVSAENAAFPHGRPGHRKIQTGDMVTMDFGGFFQGYAADMTRTIAVGHATERFRDIYLKLLEAQQTGLSLVRAGVPCKDIDRAVRDILKKYQLDQYFQHGTGHGLGLEIHEQPRISPLSDAVLLENMVVTIEPGIYIPGWGGIRIEDSVIVKNNGCEILTHSDKRLLVV